MLQNEKPIMEGDSSVFWDFYGGTFGGLAKV